MLLRLIRTFKVDESPVDSSSPSTFITHRAVRGVSREFESLRKNVGMTLYNYRGLGVRVRRRVGEIQRPESNHRECAKRIIKRRPQTADRIAFEQRTPERRTCSRQNLKPIDILFSPPNNFVV